MHLELFSTLVRCDELCFIRIVYYMRRFPGGGNLKLEDLEKMAAALEDESLRVRRDAAAAFAMGDLGQHAGVAVGALTKAMWNDDSEVAGAPWSAAEWVVALRLDTPRAILLVLYGN